MPVEQEKTASKGDTLTLYVTLGQAKMKRNYSFPLRRS